MRLLGAIDYRREAATDLAKTAGVEVRGDMDARLRTMLEAMTLQDVLFAFVNRLAKAGRVYPMEMAEMSEAALREVEHSDMRELPGYLALCDFVGGLLADGRITEEELRAAVARAEERAN